MRQEAQGLVAKGIMDDVDAIVGLHVLPDKTLEEYVKCNFKSGPMTTSADLVKPMMTGLGNCIVHNHIYF